MAYGKIAYFLKSALVPFTIIILGLSVLVGCATTTKTESALDNPAISDELPPAAAIHYLNKIVSQSRNPSWLINCDFTTYSVAMKNGELLQYTDSKLRIKLYRGWGLSSDFIALTNCQGLGGCGCFISEIDDEYTENLILTALHSLGVRELKIVN